MIQLKQVTKKPMLLIQEFISRLISKGYPITYWDYEYFLDKSKSGGLGQESD